MKMAHLSNLVAVSEHGSLRAAARFLGVTQPAITRSIREIERELGVTLFERHAKGVRPTPIGETFLRRAQSVEAELRRAREEVAQFKGQSAGEVSIAVSTASSMVLLPRALGYFRRRFPDTLVRVHETLYCAAQNDLLDGKLDLYVGPIEEALSSDKVVVETLFTNNRLVVGRPGHPLGRVKGLAELVDAHWIDATLGISAGASRIPELGVESYFADLGLPPPKIALHAGTALIAILALTSSDMLSVVPRQWLECPITAQWLEPLANIPPLVSPPICAAWRRDPPLTPIAQHLTDLLVRAGGNYVPAAPDAVAFDALSRIGARR